MKKKNSVKFIRRQKAIDKSFNETGKDYLAYYYSGTEIPNYNLPGENPILKPIPEYIYYIK